MTTTAPRRLEGKVGIVTGAGSGIGEATAAALAEAGCRVLVADIDGAAADRVAGSIEAAGGTALGHRADVAEEDEVQAMVEAAVARWGGLDLIHNNAAAMGDDVLGRDGDVASMDVDVWDRTMAVDLRGVMLGCKHAIPHLLQRGGGAIVSTTSPAGELGDLRFSAYAAAKAGICSLMRCIATQYGKAGIRANAISPGGMLTPALRSRLGEEEIAGILRHHLTPRLGAPRDIAAAVVYLASEDAEFVTGQVLHVDGGLTMHFGYVAGARPDEVPAAVTAGRA